jgi:surface protein
MSKAFYVEGIYDNNAFNEDISGWDVSSVITMRDMFS